MHWTAAAEMEHTSGGRTPYPLDPAASAAAPPKRGCPERAGPERLRVGGITPMTTVDYPGELSAVIFCQGCPWRCGYCHNGHLVPARGDVLIRWAEVEELLERRRGLLDAVVFSGGEPTAQAALPAAMARVKAMGFKVGLHTGGPYPDRVRRILPLLDWVGLDIKALPEDYPAVTGAPGSGERAWESLRLLLGAGIALQVRTTPMPGMHTPKRLERLARRLAEAGVRGHRLQECRTDRVLDPSLRLKALRAEP